MVAKKEEAGLALQQLKTDLRAKNINKLYFFHGEEVFLLQHYLQQLKKNLIEELTESFNYHRLNQENFSVQLFVDAVEFLYIFADFQSNCPINFWEFSVENLNYCRSMYFTFQFYQVFIHIFCNSVVCCTQT